MVRVRVRVRREERERSGDRTRVDGLCDFEKVLPDQLCRSAKRDLTGSHGQFRRSMLIRKGVTPIEYRRPGVTRGNASR